VQARKENPTVKYALLIYENPQDFADREQVEDQPYFGAWRAYHQALVDAGVYVAGDPLHTPDTATTVRQRDGRKHIQDGPYASTKEQLAGFILLELPSLDAALEWAARCPAAAVGAVEVRPLAPEHKRRVTCSDG
jgi:hypothetical protein